ncbi:MAG TPA: hypothetical protein VM597_40085, partial [Gemmataceae bacterium]|nr:hypothetical protein [Gemmataceae bacterium]
WDAAGGGFERPASPGPFRGTEVTYKAGEFALRAPGVGLPGPLPVGIASRDESPFGCRDMAANGYEWTRSVEGSANDVPFGLDADVVVVLRGQVYVGKDPYLFKNADLQVRPRFDSMTGKLLSSDDIGFRAAIAIPSAR